MFTSVVGCFCRYAARTASFSWFLSQPSEMAFASISGNSPLHTALIMATRSRSALIASWATAFTSTCGAAAGVFTGAAAASTFAGAYPAVADSPLGAATPGAGAGAAAGAAGAAGAAAPSTFFGASADGAAGVFTGAVAVTCGFASSFFF